MNLASILGQDHAAAFFRHALASGRLAHAYLFTGPEGVGKATFAVALARRLLCASPDDDACGACDACRRFDSSNHLGFVRVEPPADKKGVVKTVVDVESVRALEARLAMKLARGDRRVVLIDHPIGEDAANALLKILEEPPAGNVFLIVTQAPESLPRTIHSRTHRIRFRPIPDALLAARLAERHGLAPGDARFIARLAQGSFGKAAAYAEEGWMEVRGKLRAIAAGRARDPENFDMGEALEALIKEGGESEEAEGAEEAADYRKGLRQARARARAVLGALALLYRDVVMLREGGAEPADREAAEELSGLLAKVTTERLLDRLETLLQSDLHLKRNANVKLVVEWALQ